MIPERIEFQPRRRDPWEALDLGVLLARRCWRTLFASWLLTTLPTLVLLVVLLESLDYWTCLILWWLKPLFERPMVLALSRRVFGERLSWRHGLPLLLRAMQPNLLWHLSLGRLLELSRSFVVPVLLLERQRGVARWARIRIVRLGQLSMAQSLSILCLLFEVIIFFAQFVFVLMLLPAPVGLEWEYLLDWVAEQGVVPLVMMYVSMSLVAPIYVCSGFTLYLNRRSELEGWDLQVALAGLQERVGRRRAKVSTGLAARAGSRSVALLLLVASTMLTLNPGAANAATDSEAHASEAQLQPAASSREVIDRVYQLDELQIRAKEQRWFRWAEDEPNEDSNDWVPSTSYIDELAQVIEVVIWVACILGLIFLLYHFRNRLRAPVWRRNHQVREASEPVLTIPLASTTMAFDINFVRSLIEAGEYRAALGSMYRESCRLLALSPARHLAPGTTEAQLLATIEVQPSRPQTDAIAELTEVWQLVAYAHRPLERQSAMDLFERWALAVSKREDAGHEAAGGADDAR